MLVHEKNHVNYGSFGYLMLGRQTKVKAIQKVLGTVTSMKVGTSKFNWGYLRQDKIRLGKVGFNCIRLGCIFVREIRCVSDYPEYMAI